MNPSKNLRERGVKVGVIWDGKQGAGAYGNRVRKAEASVEGAEPVEEAPQAKPQVEDEAQAAIRKLWREGKRKEALSYGKK
tara:strand:+ start:449 stop:691 length:243 start_codon:yes stop_codon:yes gene_type:complete